MIDIGARMPSGRFQVMGETGPEALTADSLFAGKLVALFSVPGAFTPTCSAQHLPGFLTHRHELALRGVDTVACLAVNDVFVMSAWAKASNVGDSILMLADGNRDYTRALGLEIDLTRFQMGVRGQRFSLLVEDGVLRQRNIEASGEFRVSSAEYLLTQIDAAGR
jgi:glutaredoxin/glutathione-dependent peroxiredoxin